MSGIEISIGLPTFQVDAEPPIEKGKSIIDLPEEYICIDTETTDLTPSWGELIEIAAKHIINGHIIDSFHSLIKPESGCFTDYEATELGYNSITDVPKEVIDEYEKKHLVNSFITMLTGITGEMLLDAPKAKDVIPQFIEFCGDKLIIGHNVSFDIRFICPAAQECGVAFTNDYIDTMRIARKVFKEKAHHRLIDVAEYCKVDYPIQHRAEEDTITTYKCYEIMKSMILKESTIDDFKSLFKRRWKENGLKEALKNMVANVDEIDDTNPFFEKVVVFTGALSAMTRKDACQIILNLGGIPEDSLTKKTNYLIVGDSGFNASVKEGKSSKILKAEQYIEKGIDISVLAEKDFIAVVTEYLS